MLELEKRKQRFMEAQNKRRAEQEKKRAELEAKKNKKRDDNRCVCACVLKMDVWGVCKCVCTFVFDIRFSPRSFALRRRCHDNQGRDSPRSVIRHKPKMGDQILKSRGTSGVFPELCVVHAFRWYP